VEGGGARDAEGSLLGSVRALGFKEPLGQIVRVALRGVHGVLPQLVVRHLKDWDERDARERETHEPERHA
jgi:hypothetical protein